MLTSQGYRPENYLIIGYINMNFYWLEDLFELLILIPLKIIELVLNIFHFIVLVITRPIIEIVKILKGTNESN